MFDIRKIFDSYKNNKINNNFNNIKQINKMHPILAGSLAGGIGYIGTLPLDFIKQRLQTSSTSSRQIIQENGLRILFKGGLMGSASIIPQMAIKFSANDYLNRTTKNGPFLNGFIAGYIDGSFLGPILAIQSVLQMETKKNIGYNKAYKVLKSVPILPITVPLAFRNALYTSVVFGGQKTLAYDESFIKNFVISSVLNVPGVLACSSFDVIRAKQIQYILEKKTNNPFVIAREIYRSDGLGGYYQGFKSLYVNFAIRFPITFSLYYLLTQAQKKHSS